MGSTSISDRDFPQAFSSFYTQGKAIKLISGTKSFLQLETNSLTLVMKQPKLLYPRARTRLKPGEISTPHLFPGFSFYLFLGWRCQQAESEFYFLYLRWSRAADMHLDSTRRTLHFLVPLITLPQGYWNPTSLPNIQICATEKVASAVAEVYQQHPSLLIGCP